MLSVAEREVAAQPKQTAIKTSEEIAVNYDLAFPDVYPSSLKDCKAGVLRDGLFYPLGSVAKHYASLQFKQQREELKPHVYFIRSDRGGPVKIGVAQDVYARLVALQTAHPYPLQVIGIIRHGGRATEAALHKRFATCRLNGEWFEWNQEIEEVMP